MKGPGHGMTTNNWLDPVMHLLLLLFMDPHMAVEVARLRESQMTKLALVRLLATMNTQMLCQGARVWKCLAALPTPGKGQKSVSLLFLSKPLFLSYLSTYLYGLSPLCVLMWVVTEDDWENLRLQMEQWKGFSPLWVRQWAVKLAAWENDLLHS